ncbi:hypothetical protein YB2330_001564 [Saitoella coloradoensis]
MPPNLLAELYAAFPTGSTFLTSTTLLTFDHRSEYANYTDEEKPFKEWGIGLLSSRVFEHAWKRSEDQVIGVINEESRALFHLLPYITDETTMAGIQLLTAFTPSTPLLLRTAFQAVDNSILSVSVHPILVPSPPTLHGVDGLLGWLLYSATTEQEREALNLRYLNPIHEHDSVPDLALFSGHLKTFGFVGEKWRYLLCLLTALWHLTASDKPDNERIQDAADVLFMEGEALNTLCLIEGRSYVASVIYGIVQRWITKVVCERVNAGMYTGDAGSIVNTIWFPRFTDKICSDYIFQHSQTVLRELHLDGIETLVALADESLVDVQTLENDIQETKRVETVENLYGIVGGMSPLRGVFEDVMQNDLQGEGVMHQEAYKATLSNARLWAWMELKGHGNGEWDAAAISAQARLFNLAALSTMPYNTITSDYTHAEFWERFGHLLIEPGNLTDFCSMHGFVNGDDIVEGRERVWVSEEMFRFLEDGLMMGIEQGVDEGEGEVGGVEESLLYDDFMQSREDLLPPAEEYAINGTYPLDVKLEAGHHAPMVVEVKTTTTRKIWVAIVWGCTWWIPSFLLRYVGGMRRPDVRMAWREKLTICFGIALLCGAVIFYIIFLGKLLCPEFDKVWDAKEVAQHTNDDNFWVSIRGGVYDISKFWKLQHSDSTTTTGAANMKQFAGLDLTEYFPPPLTAACPGLVTEDTVWLYPNLTIASVSTAMHYSGPVKEGNPTTKLYDINWYQNTFAPKIKTFWKGDLVISADDIDNMGSNEQENIAIIDRRVYDLTQYFATKEIMQGNPTYSFFDPTVESMFVGSAGQDISSQFWKSPAINETTRAATYQCLQNAFYVGRVDFRKSARCQVNNYILLGFTCILCSVILIKFLSALQFGSKRRPARQDKFVILQVPAYTEGEDSLRKAIDSLADLEYDDMRKLMFIIVDGIVTGGGNEKPTSQIILDILGVDTTKDEPPLLPMKSVGEGSKQLNYARVYAGLYEFDGHVVPYCVIVKCGKPSERSKPGNRGKRDSQVLLMQFLNRVHFNKPLNPLELEIYHQITNLIGVEPHVYEYMLMVDADTQVRSDSLNRLVACCANDSKIIGICGETSIENEEGSWWTMIQVFEYYISHHLSKAFESLFGSVTCLPGCFTMYRLRTVDKHKPLIISDKVIREYSDNHVDTLHKKNLLSLGEDRYLTTLLTKHFPMYKMTFTPDAYAVTTCPEDFSVLLSQRRRWINSTVHNLAELMFLPNLCGFCCFSMRFVVIIDLFGTIILPATFAYIVYLIYVVSSGAGAFPLISIIMIAAVYGLQAIVFIVKRQWQHIGWMITYILAYPVYSFLLPVYAFWQMDNFSWGSTRIVIDERTGKKQVVVDVEDEEGFDESMVPLETWKDHAELNDFAVHGKGAEFNEVQHELDRWFYAPETLGEVGYAAKGHVSSTESESWGY